MKCVFVLKSRVIFKIFYGLCMFVNKHFINTGAYIWKSKRFYNAKPSACYFYMRTKIPLNFRICISVSLSKTPAGFSFLEICNSKKVDSYSQKSLFNNFFNISWDSDTVGTYKSYIVKFGKIYRVSLTQLTT